MLKTSVIYGFTLIGLLLLLSCNEGEESSKELGETSKSEFVENTLSEETIFEEKKEEIIVFYDTIGFKIIDLILKDRVYETNPKNKTQLQGVSLDSFPKKLNKEDEKKVKKYSQRLIEFKKGLINTLENESIVRDFENAKDSLLNSAFFKDTIINSRENKPLYEALINNIDNHFEDTKNSISENRIKRPKETAFAIIKTKTNINTEIPSKKGFSTFLKKSALWWFILFVISVLFNVFQFVLYKRKTNKIINKEAENEREIESNNTIQIKPLPEKINISEVNKIVVDAYNKLEQLLSQVYHKDCIALISLKLETLKSGTIQEATSRSFNNKKEVTQHITPKLEKHKSILQSELENCITKEQAKQKIETSIQVQNFTEGVNTELVSEEEIQTKIQQFKQTLFSELNSTITRSHLVTQIDKLETDIMAALQKMVKDSLVYYFPFADVNGMLGDTKKTKTIERDSAIHLFVNPSDITKSTFKLLYEKDDMMQAGIMSYDSFLIPICQLKSEDFNSTGTKIEQVGLDGTMEFEDGFWKVKNKLQIKVI